VALTKVTGQVINDSTGLVVGVTTVGGGLSATDGFFSGIVTAVGNASFSGNLTVGGVLTYEDVTNVDSVGLVTARNGIVVGSGITLSKDGDIFATGITTISENLKVGTGVTLSPDGDGFYTGVVTATSFKGDGSNLTGIANATTVTIADESSDTTCFPLFATAATGDLAPKSGTNLTFNSSSGALTATSFAGDGSALTGISSPNLGATETQGYQNLKILTTANNSTVITCDSVLLANTSGVLVKVDSVNVTLDATGTGLNGLDTGSLAGEKFYYIWIINNGSTTGAIASLSSTSPTLPSGYTYKARVGGVATNIGSGTDLLLGQQINSTYMFARSESDIVKVTNGNGGQSATQFAVPNVSSLASDWTAFVKTSGATNAGTTHKFVFAGASGANDSDNRYARIWQMYHVTGNGIGDMNFQVPFIPVLTLSSGVPQAWLATNGSTGPNWYVYCTGFKY